MADETIRYLFILALILIVVAYFAGSTAVLSTLGTQIAGIGNVFTGRNSSGQFANYPQNK